jgi:hypothetical protein
LTGRKMRITFIRVFVEEKYSILKQKRRIHSAQSGVQKLLDVTKEVLKKEIYN